MTLTDSTGAGRTMKAAWLTKPGPPEVLEVTSQAPVPVRRRGELLVNVHAAGINPVDCKLRGLPGFMVLKPKVSTKHGAFPKSPCVLE